MKTIEKSKTRKASISDIDQLVELENKCFDSDKFNRNQFKYLLSKAKGFVFIYEIGDNIVGSLILLSRKNSPKLRIYSVAVNPEYQGQGIAGHLLKQAQRMAKEQHKKYLTLEVKSINETAIKLYLKFGFKTISVKENYYSDGNSALVMKIEI